MQHSASARSAQDTVTELHWGSAKKGLAKHAQQSPAPVINTPKQLKSCSKGVLLELLSIVYSDPGKAFKCNAASSSPQNGLKIILKVKQKGRYFNIKMPSSSQWLHVIFANNGVNSALTHEEGKCLSISHFRLWKPSLQMGFLSLWRDLSHSSLSQIIKLGPTARALPPYHQNTKCHFEDLTIKSLQTFISVQ